MTGHFEKESTGERCFLNDIRQSFNIKFKPMVPDGADKLITALQCYGSKHRKAQGDTKKQKLINANSTQKSLSGPKFGHFQEFKHETPEFVHLKRKTRLPLTHNCIKYKTKQLAEKHNLTWHQCKASPCIGVCA
jgi:hypothetical protein